MAPPWPFLLPALLLLSLLGYTRYTAALVLLSALLPAYVLRLTVAGVPTNALELAVLAVALAGAAQPAVRRRWRHALTQLPLLPALLIVLLLSAALASALLSPHQRTSWGIVKGWVAAPLVFGALVYAAGTRASTRRSIVAALLASGIAMALIGLTQVTAAPRVSGWYDVPNSLALFLTPLTIIAWWQKKRFILITLAAGLFATQSASALAAVIFTYAAGLAAWPHRRTKSALMALILFAVLAAAYLAAAGRLAYFIRPVLNQDHSSITVRLQLWSIAAELVREHPLRGVGLGAFEPAYQQKLHERFARFNQCRRASAGNCPPEPMPEFVFRDPHNWPLSFWLNTGLLGLASFAHLNFWLLRRVVRRPQIQPARLASAMPERALPASRRFNSAHSQSLALALVSLLFVGLVETIYWKNDLAALHWLLFALLLHQVRANRVQYEPSQHGDDYAKNR